MIEILANDRYIASGKFYEFQQQNLLFFLALTYLYRKVFKLYILVCIIKILICVFFIYFLFLQTRNISEESEINFLSHIHSDFEEIMPISDDSQNFRQLNQQHWKLLTLSITPLQNISILIC